MKTVKFFGDSYQRVSYGEKKSKLMFSVDTLRIYIGFSIPNLELALVRGLREDPEAST